MNFESEYWIFAQVWRFRIFDDVPADAGITVHKISHVSDVRLLALIPVFVRQRDRFGQHKRNLTAQAGNHASPLHQLQFLPPLQLTPAIERHAVIFAFNGPVFVRPYLRTT